MYKAGKPTFLNMRQDDYNSFEKPNVVAPKEFTGAKVNKGSLKVTLPAKSIVVLEVK